MKTPFVDIHTHKKGEGCGFSYGIHPWSVQPGCGLALPSNALAIGETGLDRHHKDTYDLQLEIFEKHILLSEQYQKPLIIHNVKATADILRLHKKYHPQQAWIIHGFNGSVEEAHQLTDQKCYLSVGESIFYPNRKITKTISSIPLEYLFLETDTSEKTIQQIYEKAAELLNLSIDQLKEQIFANFTRLNLNVWKTGNNAPDCSSETMALINGLLNPQSL